LAVELKSFCSRGRALEVDEAVSGIGSLQPLVTFAVDKWLFDSVPSEFVPDHLHVDLLAHAIPQASDEILVNPRLEFTHPKFWSALGVENRQDDVPERGLVVWIAARGSPNLQVVARVLARRTIDLHLTLTS
jgi:hypothetical protein